jgi:hypothetical protein
MNAPVAHAEILSPALQSRKDTLAREFRDAEPFPHVVFTDFFAPEFAELLLGDFPTFEARHAMGEMGEVGRKATRSDVRDISTAYSRLDDFLQAPEFLGLMSAITGIPDLLYDPDYHGGGTHENLHGQGMYIHVDFNYHPRGWHRRLNLIVYLSPEWEEEWGGSLTLHSDAWEPSTDTVRSIPPQFNLGVLFETSEHSWHGFSHVDLPESRRDLSRKSFAIYLYTEDRPVNEVAARHSTIYVPDGMPDDVGPGTVLNEEQSELLGRRFNEFRSMLKHQYDRQLELAQTVDDLTAGNRRLEKQYQELDQAYRSLNEYRELALRLGDVTRDVFPQDAIVLVASAGDENLLKFGSFSGWHFPRADSGDYLGYNPADSDAAIAHLEDLRAQGADYLLLPATSFWWLEHYPGLAEHLDLNYQRILGMDGTCVVFDLSARVAGSSAKP